MQSLNRSVLLRARSHKCLESGCEAEDCTRSLDFDARHCGHCSLAARLSARSLLLKAADKALSRLESPAHLVVHSRLRPRQLAQHGVRILIQPHGGHQRQGSALASARSQLNASQHGNIMGMGVAAGLTREERKKARELEEARRNGTAALEVGSDGKTVRRAASSM